MVAAWITIFQIQERDARGIYEKTSTSDVKYVCRDIEALDESSEKGINEEKLTLSDPLSCQDKLSGSSFWSVALLLISIFLFACSLLLSAFMYHRAVSDAACQRKMWAFSKRTPKRIGVY
jgi:hypothetical protein